ncbi:MULTISPECIES: phytoene desaturase family protein [Alcanivorax]|jgi:phytoene dehydrogenase-like protein|uniref:phytoene desaturase family protein n=1 Tax=Alcanivorax TaxID=59753 RepID=UPI0023522DA6|nr:NAD(P)/FAD-dependent oxidoreductase [Alcanivorax jadensis]MDF1639198.1 NAD(P)/FAD-dependent oxidoreductase [Alcanivorax jadensis]|tara:strand:+ start:3670 stop:5475 length:1806 start_codon:yes stop_codon:yes gene_type:complete
MTSGNASSAHSENWDAIVIGAGLGGLSSAAYLAASGKRTLLLERYAVLGGSSHVFRRKKKWEFDCGVHYIGDCGPGSTIATLMQGLGLDDRIHWLQLDRDGFDTIIGPDLELRTPSCWDQYLENLLLAFPGEARGLRFYISVMRRIANSLDPSVSFSSKTEMAKFAARCGWAAPWIMMPHASLLAACRLRPRTIMTLSLQDAATATTPDAAPVMMRASFLHDFINGGAWYPKGGGQMIAAGFAEVIRSHGGEIRTQTHVDRILIEGGAVKGVRLEGGRELRASAVVAAGDIKRTYRDLVGYENLPASVTRRSENWKMSHPLINGFFGIEIDISKTPNTNYYVVPNWDSTSSLWNLHRSFSRRVTRASGRDPIDWAQDFARNQPAFVQCSTRRDLDNHRSAPSGHAAIEAQTLAPSDPNLWGFNGYDVATGAYRRDSRYQEIKEIISAGLLDRIEQAYPGASAKVAWNEQGTPASQERFTYTSQGAAFGIEPRITQFGPFRPGVNTVIKGLFMAGASTTWGPGTAGAMLSGLYAASAITGRNLQEEIRSGKVLADPTRFSQWGPDFDPLTACRLKGQKKQTRQEAEAEERENSAPLKRAVKA